MAKKIAIGIDIGGTGTRIVAIDHLGTVVSEIDAPTADFELFQKD